MQKNTMLTNLARYDKGVIGNEVVETPEGFIKGLVNVTRCGVFLYRNADGTIRKELRHPDDVNQEESLSSIKMIPIVNGHPKDRLVTPENAKKLSVGYTGEHVSYEYPHVVANVVITDKDTIEEIKDDMKNELSLGYTVDLIEEGGVYNGEPYDFRQTNIRYNHLALVDQARAGPECRIALDGDDAELITQEAEVAKRKVKIDAEEYMLEDDAAGHVEKMMKEKSELEKRIEELNKALDTAHAERDSLRDKDVHDPESVHHPLENDEIGSKGKEEKDPIDNYGMQSHVRDYTPPTKMENHVVNAPKNEHYPHDLPRIPNVDAAEVNRRVKDRVKLEKIAESYLDRKTLTRMDDLSDIQLKAALIQAMQPNADLRGKSENYINARFDAAIEDHAPKSRVIATPSHYVNDEDDDEKSRADADDSRKQMIKRQRSAWMPKAKVGR